MTKELSTIGLLLKEEQLQTVDYNIIPDTLVLEIQQPFPGYDGSNIPKDSVPESFIIITAKEYRPEEILRASAKINQYLDIQIDAAPAWIEVYNKKYYGVRIKGCMTYEKIKDVQAAFLNEKIELAKKVVIKDKGIIKIQKYFIMDEVQDSIYLDINNDWMGYIKIDHFFSWKLFEKITMLVKNNIDNRNFDAALTSLFVEDTVVDLIRIYKKGIKEEILVNIKKKYDSISKDFI